jgi:hypothetical protein
MLALGVVWSGDAAIAEKRLALVIGNDLYGNLTPADQLKKVRNDARAMAAALRGLGFDVITGENVDRRDFNLKLQKFAARIQPGDQAAVFFAGHGVAIGSVNYLLPSDVPRIAAGQEGLLASEAIDADRIVKTLRRRGARISLIILDACRNNPFADKRGRSIGAARGLSRMDPPEGTLVMYSAGAGQQALDRLGERDKNPNSVFTRTLLPLLQTPGLEINVLAREVKRRVRDLARTVGGHRQTPAVYNEVIGNFYLKPGGGKPAPVAALPPAPAGKNGKAPVNGAKTRDGQLAYLKAVSAHTLPAYQKFLADFPNHPKAAAVRDIMSALLDERFWLRTKKAATPNAYQLYIKAFPKGSHVAEAQSRIANMTGSAGPPPAKAGGGKLRPATAPPGRIAAKAGVSPRADTAPASRAATVIDVGSQQPAPRPVRRPAGKANTGSPRPATGQVAARAGAGVRRRARRCGHPHGRYRVSGVLTTNPLEIRQGPGRGFPVVSSIPANASGMAISDCVANPSGVTWCRIRHRCATGYLPAGFLIDALTGQRPGTERVDRAPRNFQRFQRFQRRNRRRNRNRQRRR